MRPAISSVIAVMVCCIALLSATAPVRAESAPLSGPTTIYLPLLKGRPSAQTLEQQAFAAQVLSLVNVERAAAGCGPLFTDEKLTVAAQAHSQDMADNNFFNHSGSTGSSAADRATNAGYSWTLVGENIAVGYTTPEKVVAGWMKSDGHRKNILNCSYVQTGIGYVFQANDAPLAGQSVAYYHYWTQDFAAPR